MPRFRHGHVHRQLIVALASGTAETARMAGAVYGNSAGGASAFGSCYRETRRPHLRPRDKVQGCLSVKVGVIETEVIQHQLQITAVGFEIDVEHVAEHRDAAGRRIERDVDQHLEKLVVWHTETPGLVDDDEADGGSSEIADAGDQAEDGVGAKRHTRAWNSERRVHQPG